MDSSSNDPLYYLKVIAEQAEKRELQQKKQTRNVLIAVAMLIVAGGGFSFIMESNLRDLQMPKETNDWYDVSSAEKKGNYEKALAAADQMLAKNPKDFDGYYKKGEIQLVLGDKEGALKSFQTAYDLFPVHKYKEAVDALKPKPKVVLPGQPATATTSAAQVPAKAKP